MFYMRAHLTSAAAILLALAAPLAAPNAASGQSRTLKAVIFEDLKPLYEKTDDGYAGLGVDLLE